MKILYYIALTLVIVGALNCLLIGLFKFDLVATLFGTMSLLSRIVYSLVGLSGIISIPFLAKTVIGQSENSLSSLVIFVPKCST